MGKLEKIKAEIILIDNFTEKTIKEVLIHN